MKLERKIRQNAALFYSILGKKSILSQKISETQVFLQNIRSRSFFPGIVG